MAGASCSNHIRKIFGVMVLTLWNNGVNTAPYWYGTAETYPTNRATSNSSQYRTVPVLSDKIGHLDGKITDMASPKITSK